MSFGQMAPALFPPTSSFQVLHTPRSDQQRRQCEGAGGLYSRHCQQPGQMMPGFAYTPNLPPGLPQHLQAPPCMEYCTFTDGRQSTYNRGMWSPPLTALMGMGAEDTPSSLFFRFGCSPITWLGVGLLLGYRHFNKSPLAMGIGAASGYLLHYLMMKDSILCSDKPLF